MNINQFTEISSSSEKMIQQIQIDAYNKVTIHLKDGQERSVSPCFLNFPKLNEAKLVDYLSQTHLLATELSDGSYKVSATPNLLGGGLFFRTIHKAATTGDIALLKETLETKVPNRYSVDVVYFSPGHGRTALQIACESDGSANFVEIAALLIKAGANVNLSSNGNYQTPLALAMKKNNFEIAKKLIEAGANVNCRIEVRPDGEIKDVTPLQIACRKENLELVQLMIEKGANVNETGTAGVAFNEEDSWYSPLAEAAKSNNITLAKALITAKAETTIITEVTRNRYYDSATKTTKKSIDTKRIGFYEWACWPKNSEFLKLAVEAGAKFQFLHMSAKYGNDTGVDYLISKGCDVDEYDNKNATPLAIALQEAKYQTATLLLDRGADPTKILPTLFAAMNSDAHYVIQSHKQKAPPMQARSMHQLPLSSMSTQSMHQLPLSSMSTQSMPQMIYTSPMPPMIPQPPSSDLLNNACQRGDLTSVQSALTTGLKPDSKTLTFACISGKMEIIDLILSKGAMPDNETLTTACATNNLAIVQKIVNCGAKPNKQTIEIAKQTKNYEIINLILTLVSQNL